jgi:ribosomal protein S18 acetylase RimI-like enzyme
MISERAANCRLAPGGMPPFDCSMRAEEYRIADAAPEQLADITAVDRAASECFPLAVLPAHCRRAALSLDTLIEAQRNGVLWVATTPANRVVGFLLAQVTDCVGYVAELSVEPAHQRRGVGRRLMDRACVWATQSRLEAMTLTTFTTVPWNAPWYRRLGFVELDPDELSPFLRMQLARERNIGLENRVAMRRPCTVGKS